METTNRKSIRLKGYDYSKNGCYFITICVKDKRKILSKIYPADRVGTDVLVRPQYEIKLSAIGNEVEKTINYINENYEGVNIDNYCIMPDHVHMLITLSNENSDRRGRLSLRDVVSRFKAYTTKRYREIYNDKTLLLWQQRFNDHIIRNDEDYIEKHEYITNNSLKFIIKNRKQLDKTVCGFIHP